MGKWKILITGVTGQLGSHLADYYLERGFEVTGFSRRTGSHSTGRIDHIMDNPDFTYLEGDVTDLAFLVQLFKRLQPDYCVNTAAQSHVATSFTNRSSSFDITAKGAMNVVDALLECSPHTRLVQMSTSEMFGDQYDRHMELPPDNIGLGESDQIAAAKTVKFQNENTRMNPQSPYAISKLAAYHYVRLMRKVHNAHLSSLIAFNFEGPRRGQHFVTQKIVQWFKGFKARRDEIGDFEIEYPKLRLGNILAMRDWTYCEDTVRAIDLVLNLGSPVDVVVGSGETRTVEEFLAAVCKEILGEDDYMKYVVIDPEFYRPAEVDFLRADPSKIKRLGWEPKVGFEELVRKMCGVYQC